MLSFRARPGVQETIAHKSEGPNLSPLMSHSQKVQYRVWRVILLGTLAYFWIWWLQPEHNIGTFSYVLNVIVIAWVTLLPLYFILILSRARVPAAELPVSAGYRVAMVVTKVPSEPFPIVRETLEAMLRQTYPHDTWLADEDPSSETLRWCREHGVMISTRKNRADYHRPHWPSAALDGFCALVVRQLPLAAELHAVRHCPLAAIAGTLADQLALKFSDPGKQGRKQPALR